MKKIFLFLIFACGFANAQYLIEDNDITENSKEVGKTSVSYDLKNPLEFYRLKCTEATYAQFPGGENAFKTELQKAMKKFVDQESYSVNGTFDFVFCIDKSGNLKNFVLLPAVANSNILFNDLKLAIEKVNKKWIPANCNGVPVDSKLRLRVNFSSENFDL